MVQALGVRQLAPRPGKSIFSDSFPFQQQHANCLSHIHHSQMCIRETDETMKKLMSTVYSQLQSKLSQMGISTRADPFNVLMVHVIRPGQTTPRHADTNYTIEGRFDVGSNSQQKDSIVAIFAFADSRTLKFSLVYKKTTRKKVKGKMTVKTVPVPHFLSYPPMTRSQCTASVLAPKLQNGCRTGPMRARAFQKMPTSHSASHYARASILWRCTSSLAS